MIDKQRHHARVRRAPAPSLPGWAIVLMAASVAVVATLVRQLG